MAHHLLRFLVSQVCRSGKGYSQLVQDSALSAVLRFVNRVMCSGASPPCIAAHIVGSSVVHTVVALTPESPGMGGQLNDAGARAVCSILQVIGFIVPMALSVRTTSQRRARVWLGGARMGPVAFFLA